MTADVTARLRKERRSHHCCEHHIPRAPFVVWFDHALKLRVTVKGDQAGLWHQVEVTRVPEPLEG